jgi:uncharacterized sulfatase
MQVSRLCLSLILIALASLASNSFAAEPKRYNVLHIISDDLCTRLGCYGDPMVKSPNIDRLAARGVRFDRAYCQFPLCNPSRCSFMTGLRPDVTKAFENQTHFRTAVPDAVSMPQTFQKAGYSVTRIGKIYHYSVPAQIGTDGFDDKLSWQRVVNPKGRDMDDYTMIEQIALTEDKLHTTTTKTTELTQLGATLSWLAADGEDIEQTDGKIAAQAVNLLEENARSGKPFYLAVGFFRPHTPYVSPKKYFAMYPPESIKLPVVPPNLAELFPAAPLMITRKVETLMSDDLRRKAIQAYSAATTFMDAQVGVLLDAVDRLKLANSTIIVFHSDHGYHLGEKGLWQKMSLFEESTRVPLVIVVPGSKANGTVSPRTVELVDLHKTLADLCGLTADTKTQGTSLRPLLEDPKSAWDLPAYSQVTRGLAVGTFEAAQNKGKKGFMGRSVRTERWRYTEWDDGQQGVELYDHDNDAAEMKNLANDPTSAQVVGEMRELLRKGGR